MIQLALEMPAPRARRKDPETSHQAAAKASGLAQDHCRLITLALQEHGPQTIYELAARTRLSHVQIARRLPELAAADFVVVTNETRAGSTGRQCRVWRIA